MDTDNTVSNPMLVGAMQLIKADGKTPVPEHQAMFMQELDKAELLAPSFVISETGADGEPVEGGRNMTRFPVLNSGDGKKFFVVFTDSASLDQAKSIDGVSKLPEEFLAHTSKVRFTDITKLIMAKAPDGSDNGIFGVVINPFMENVVIPKTMIMEIIRKTAEEAMARMAAAQAKNPGNTPGQEAPDENGKVIRFPFADKKD
ncbi:MAG: SseB family protein [Lachnospiraceae bacterium]|nr:SseB family protein [Lachnospiraceae bacterium]